MDLDLVLLLALLLRMAENSLKSMNPSPLASCSLISSLMASGVSPLAASSAASSLVSMKPFPSASILSKALLTLVCQASLSPLCC